jgi:hypothetical protein
MAAPPIRGSTAPVSGLSTTSPAGTQVGDLVICATWERAGAGSPTHTCQTGSGFVEINSHAHDDGSTDGRLSCAYKIATSGGANAYAAYTTGGSGTVYTGCIVLSAGGYSIGTLPTSAADSSTNNSAPNPPQVTSLTGDYLVLAMAGWHLGSAATVAVTAPTNYTETWEIAGSADVEFSLATRALTGLSASTEDPGAFGDDVAPNGCARMTIAIKAPSVLERSCATSATCSTAVSGWNRYPTSARAMADAVGQGTTWTAGWLLDETSGAPQAAFGSPNLSLVNTPTQNVTGIYAGDKAVTFGGSTDSLSAGDSFDVGATADLVFAIVFKTADFGVRSVLHKYASGSASGYRLTINTTDVSFTAHDGTNSIGATVSLSLDDFFDQWMALMLVVTENGSGKLARVGAVNLSNGTATVGTQGSQGTFGDTGNSANFVIGAETDSPTEATNISVAAAYVGVGTGNAGTLSANLETGLASLRGYLENVAPFTTVERSCAVTGTVTTAVTSRRVLLRSASATGTCTTAVTSERDVLRSVSATGTATAAVTARRDLLRSVSSAGTGTATVAGAPVRSRAALLAAASLIAVTGMRDVLRSTSATGTVTTAVDGHAVVERSAAASGTVTTAVSGARVCDRSVAAAGTVTIDVSGEVVPETGDEERSVAVSATVTTAVSGHAIRPRAAAVAGTATTSTAGLRALLRAVNVAGTSTTSVAGMRDVLRATGAAGTSSIAVGHEREVMRSASVTGTGTIAVAGELQGTMERAASASATGTIAVDSERVLLRSASVSATGSATVAGHPLRDRSVAIAASGSITAAGLREIQRSAGASGTATIAVVGIRDLARSAALAATGTISTSGGRAAPAQLTATLAPIDRLTATLAPVAGRTATLAQIGDRYTVTLEEV